MKIKTRCVFTVPRLHSSSLEFHPFSFLRLVSLSLLHVAELLPILEPIGRSI